MTYDYATRTITLGREVDFLADFGLFSVHHLQDTAGRKDAPKSVEKDWGVIAKWISYEGEFNEQQIEKIKKGWSAYLALGLAPSLELQEAFDLFYRQYKEEGYDIKSNKPPKDVMAVFDRMLATEVDIQKKRERDLEAENAKLKAHFAKLNRAAKPPRARLTRRKRAAIALSVAWLVWVAFRTSDSYELFGFYWHRWPKDMFLANAFLPIAGCVAVYLIYRWVLSAKR